MHPASQNPMAPHVDPTIMVFVSIVPVLLLMSLLSLPIPCFCSQVRPKNLPTTKWDTESDSHRGRTDGLWAPLAGVHVSEPPRLTSAAQYADTTLCAQVLKAPTPVARFERASHWRVG